MKLQHHHRRNIIVALIKINNHYDNNVMVVDEFNTLRNKKWRGNLISVTRRSGGGSIPVHLITLSHAYETCWTDREGAVVKVLQGILQVA